jgi:hypothetical protein
LTPSGPVKWSHTARSCRGQKDLEPEERTAQSFQLNPIDQLIGVNLFGVHPERIAVRQFALSSIGAAERLDEPPVEIF